MSMILWETTMPTHLFTPQKRLKIMSAILSKNFVNDVKETILTLELPEMTKSSGNQWNQVKREDDANVRIWEKEIDIYSMKIARRMKT